MPLDDVGPLAASQRGQASKSFGAHLRRQPHFAGERTSTIDPARGKIKIGGAHGADRLRHRIFEADMDRLDEPCFAGIGAAIVLPEVLDARRRPTLARATDRPHERQL